MKAVIITRRRLFILHQVPLIIKYINICTEQTSRSKCSNVLGKHF